MKSGTVRAMTLKNISRNCCFAVFLFTASFFTAGAQKATDSSVATIASVSYLGNENEQLFFSMKYENESGEKYAVTITNEDGTILFTEVYADKKFSKTFKVPSAAGSLTFIISNPKNKEEKKFQATMEHHFKEEFSVTKITKHP
jgi:hypothetical protein